MQDIPFGTRPPPTSSTQLKWINPHVNSIFPNITMYGSAMLSPSWHENVYTSEYSEFSTKSHVYLLCETLVYIDILFFAAIVFALSFDSILYVTRTAYYLRTPTPCKLFDIVANINLHIHWVPSHTPCNHFRFALEWRPLATLDW